jgi:hypothetical protein
MVEPKMVEPKMVEPKVTEPKKVEPQVTEPKAIEPQVKEQKEEKKIAPIVPTLAAKPKKLFGFDESGDEDEEDEDEESDEEEEAGLNKGGATKAKKVGKMVLKKGK